MQNKNPNTVPSTGMSASLHHVSVSCPPSYPHSPYTDLFLIKGQFTVCAVFEYLLFLYYYNFYLKLDRQSSQELTKFENNDGMKST